MAVYESLPHSTTEMLIDEVKKYPNLYAPFRSDSRDYKKREMAWLAVAQAINLPADTCQVKWRNLRDRFCKEKKRIVLGDAKACLGTGSTKQGSWQHVMEKLSFLTEHIRHRGLNRESEEGFTQETTQFANSQHEEELVECNIKHESVSEDSYYSEDSSAVIQPPMIQSAGYQPAETGMNGCEEFVVSDYTDNLDTASHAKKHKSSEVVDNCSHVHDSTTTTTTQTLNVSNDPITLYALSLVDRLKVLGLRKRSYVMYKIQELLYEAECDANDGFS